jgi:hypothetical protein
VLKRAAGRDPSVGLDPVHPRVKWRAITLATLLLVPAFWILLAGLVSRVAGGSSDAPDPAASVAFGLAIVPFVFIVLTFLSQNPRAPISVVKAMGLALVVGLPVTVLGGDLASGIVAGTGAGGVVAMRMDGQHHLKGRWIAVVASTAFTYLLIRTVGAIALLPAPVLPFTSLGIADHLSERRARIEAEQADVV